MCNSWCRLMLALHFVALLASGEYLWDCHETSDRNTENGDWHLSTWFFCDRPLNNIVDEVSVGDVVTDAHTAVGTLWPSASNYRPRTDYYIIPRSCTEALFSCVHVPVSFNPFVLCQQLTLYFSLSPDFSVITCDTVMAHRPSDWPGPTAEVVIMSRPITKRQKQSSHFVPKSFPLIFPFQSLVSYK